MLPLSVDASLPPALVLLHEARNDRDAPGLARFMLWLGISAFVGAVEIAMQVVRRLPGHARERARTAPGRDRDAATAAGRLVRAWRGFSGIVTWPRAQHPGLAGAVRGDVASDGSRRMGLLRASPARLPS